MKTYHDRNLKKKNSNIVRGASQNPTPPPKR